MRIVVAGATGLVGQEVLKLLLQDNRFYEVIVYSRRPLVQSHPRLMVIRGDLAEIKTHRAELSGDVFISCLGTTIKTAGTKEDFRRVDFDGVLEWGRIAKENGAQKFILVSAQGANTNSPFFYPRVKGEAEAALEELVLPALTIFRPSLLVGDRSEKRGAEEFAIRTYRMLSPMLPIGLRQRLGTEVSRLAEEIVAEALDLSTGMKIRSPVEI